MKALVTSVRQHLVACFSYYAPSITTVSPSTGNSAGGITVTVTAT
jgi:hypothetical protein